MFATIGTVDVVDFDDSDRVLASISGPELAVAQLSIRPRDPKKLEPADTTLVADDPELEPNESMLAFIDESDVPHRIVHRIGGTGATNLVRPKPTVRSTWPSSMPM